MVALCRHPDELAKVRANPALIPSLVEYTTSADQLVQGLGEKRSVRGA